MKTYTRILNASLLAAALAASACGASAAGLLGQRYIGATFDVVDFDVSYLDTGYGATLALNHPVAKSFDLTLDYSYLRTEIWDIRQTMAAHQVMIGGRWFTELDPKLKIFFDGAVGYTRVSVDGGSDSDGIYSFSTGLEWMATENFALTPFVSWADSFESGVDDSFAYGVLGSVDFGGSWNLIASISANDDSDIGYSIGLTFGF